MIDLESIELIKQLKARYFRSIDTCDLKTLEQVFTPDAWIHYRSPTYDIRHEGWQAELERVNEAVRNLRGVRRTYGGVHSHRWHSYS